MADSEHVEDSAVHKIRNWGESSLPPTLLATLVTAQHLKPFQTLPMLFPPVLLLSSYLNINGFKTDAAGISAAWSGLYLLLAMRRKQGIRNKFGVRGVTRGATLGLCAVNLVGGGLAYTFGKREDQEE
ncbi:gb [Venturia nashicola]|uniref:Gb n=1 Tax=Venturia nashicola TaxID=86259 RepID=A0A4Z1P279_9PEZI|nr:gb [Venturia nashicola]TLD22555.1 gb [Venturia nashicola]